MKETNTQVRTKFRFVKEKDLTVGDKHKEIGLFSVSEKSLSVGIGGDSYIYLPSIETLNEDFVSKVTYTRDMLNKADIEMVYSKSEVDDKIAQAMAGNIVDLSDYYNKSEVDDKLLLKADLSLVYTKSDVDDLIALIPNFDSSLYYNKSDIDGKLALKLDIGTYNSDKVNYVLKSDLVNYYLKGDIDSKLDEKVDVVDYKADKLTFATKDELNLKLDASTYNSDKTTFATKLELADKADDSKIGDLQNTGLTGSTVTELLTDANTKITNIDLSNFYTKNDTYTKSEVDDLIDLIPVFNDSDYYNKTTMDGLLDDKADKTSLDNYYNKSFVDTNIATKAELANKADTSDLTNYYTKDEANGLLSNKLDNNALDNYYTKSETYKKDEIDGKVDDKLDASIYNTDKSTYALKTDLSDINIKLEKLNNSIRPVLSLTEDTATVEGQLDKQAWLTQKLKTEKQLDPENGLVITTSDGDSYFYFDGQWTLKKTYKVSHVTDTVMGIVQSKSDKGYGYIKASPSNDGTMVLADYQDILDAIDLKADDSDLTTLSGKVSTLEGIVSQKADSSSIGNLTISGLSGSNVTELLTSVKGELDLKATKLEVSGIDGRVSTLEGEIANKLNSSALNDYYNKSHIDTTFATKSELTQNYYNSTTIDSKLGAKLDDTALDSYYDALHIDSNFATKSELSNKVDNNTLTQDYYNKSDVDQKITQAVTGGQVDLTNYYTKGETYSQTQADGKFALITDLNNKADDSKIGDLQSTGLTGTNVTELLTDANTKITNINIGNYYTKREVDDSLKLKLNASEITNYYPKTETYSQVQADGKFALISAVNTKADQSSIGDLQNTGLTGNTVTELLTDANTKITNINIGNYYNKREVDDSLKLKLDASEISKYYPKTETYSQLEADGKFALISVVNTKADDSKVGDLQGTGLTGATVTELLTDAKNKIDLKAAQSDVVSLTGRVGTLEGEIANKLNSNALDDYYNETTIDGLLANKANQSSIGNLQNTGLTGSTVTELLTDAKNKVDAKLDASTYNSDKSGFATTRSVEQLNGKIEKLNNSIRPVLMLSEDTSTVEGQSDTQAWLTQKLKTEKQLDPENGLVITTSDGDSYFYFDRQWVLRKTYKVGSVTNSTSGIVLGKDEVGHGYIKASDALDGTMVLVDYQDIVDSIGTKAESSTVNGLNTRLGTVEGQLDNKVDNNTLNSYYTSSAVDSLLSAKLNSADAARDYATKGEVSVKANQSSIGNLQNTGLTGTTVTELLTDANTKIDNINISNYYPIGETYNRTEINGFLTSKANDADVVKLTGDQSIAGTKTFTGAVILGERLRYSTPNMSWAPSTDRSGDIYLSDGSIGSNCISNLNLESRARIKNVPNPTDAGDAINKRYVDNIVGTLSSLSTTDKTNLVSAINELQSTLSTLDPIVLPAGTQPTTANIGSMKVCFVLK